MKFDLYGARSAYVFEKQEDGSVVMLNCHGFAVESEDLKELCEGLLKTAFDHEKDLIIYNTKREVEFEKELHDYGYTPKEKTKANVYLMECGDRYKIGVSRNIKRRIKELNKRPFETRLVKQSKPVVDAYLYESELHENYEDKKISGEWFNLTQHDVNVICSYLENLE